MSSATSELRDIILRAGAGAGKTTTLTHLFLNYASDFKNKHQRFPRIVVTTFTRKATQELKERLLHLSMEQRREDLFHYITNKSQVQISTIHGVLSLFLGRYGHRIGLSSDFKLLSGPQENLMRRKIIRRLILSNHEYESLLETYSFRQLESALQKYYENSFLFQNFNFIKKEEFAVELQKHLAELEALRKQVSSQVLAETQQASWVKYAEGLQRFHLKVEAKDAPEALQTIKNFFADNPRKPSLSAKNPAVSTETGEMLASLVDHLKDLLDSPEYMPVYWEEHEKKNQIFSNLAQEFTRDLFNSKVTTGSIAMSDLELLSLKLIHESQEACDSFAAEWDYWMIDEYQDTSPIQVALLKAMVGDRKSFVVGDPQQSIYLFRGARSEVFQEKVVQTHESGGEVQEKLVNYRSTPRLLHFINHYFLKSSDQFAAMEPAPGKTLGALEAPVAQVRLIEKAEALSGLSEETQAALERIQDLLALGVDAEKICVLSRTRNALESLAKAAEAYGVPVQIHVAGGFYERREVLDTLALLKFLINPHDNLNFLSCLRSPWLQVPDQDILSYCHSQAHSFWSQAVKLVPETEARHPVTLLKKYIQLSQGLGFSFVLRRMMVELGLLDYVQKLDPTGRREANLWKLVSNLFEQERTPGFNFLDFLDGLQEGPDVDGGGEDSDATPVIAPKRVNLMTIHASKGLQFDHVLLLGMTSKPRLSHSELFSVDEDKGQWSLSLMNEEERKIQPSRLAIRVKEKFNQRELQEHLRVLYVALTRAKESLTLLWSGKPEKNSWAATCPLNLVAGVHQEKDFSYAVLEGSFAPQIQQREELKYLTDPGPWKQEKTENQLQTLAVTRLISAENESAAKSPSLPANVLQKALAKAYRGTEAHRIFESLKYTPLETVLEHIDDKELQDAVHFIAETNEIPLLKIIQDGHVEWGFSFQHQGLWIQGQIDLWGAVNDEVWIVDYKTGSSDHAATAFEQLKAYTWALHKMNFIAKNAKVHLAVVYPFEKKIKTEKGIDLSLLEKRFLVEPPLPH
ncbi:UvrD-helicase domain-containing protein [Bdellovibrio sp. HCB337]|uniref:UvrD-helicase domain-containing protein n=1 Tax=Bdellovibrio sp. HCB337 TaxID=3394358 RepID=UPI0039A60EC2